jgi:hypothetical protein
MGRRDLPSYSLPRFPRPKKDHRAKRERRKEEGKQTRVDRLRLDRTDVTSAAADSGYAHIKPVTTVRYFLVDYISCRGKPQPFFLKAGLSKIGESKPANYIKESTGSAGGKIPRTRQGGSWFPRGLLSPNP